MPNLYIVATPIGNLEDVSLRALRILREVKLIAAEDTRRTKKLLAAYDIKTPLTSYHSHNKRTKLSRIIQDLKEVDVALVSDAGMPGVSDPGYELVKAAVECNIPVIPIPGPSVIVTALAISGLPAHRFLYLGFLPRSGGRRRRLLKSMVGEGSTIIFFEAPHRLQETLKDIMLELGDRKLAVCRELTKVYEEIFRGKVSQAIEHFVVPRGEFTIVVEGVHGKAPVRLTDDIKKELHDMRRSEIPARDAIDRMVNKTGLSRRELYKIWLKSD